MSAVFSAAIIRLECNTNIEFCKHRFHIDQHEGTKQLTQNFSQLSFFEQVQIFLRYGGSMKELENTGQKHSAEKEKRP